MGLITDLIDTVKNLGKATDNALDSYFAYNVDDDYHNRMKALIERKYKRARKSSQSSTIVDADIQDAEIIDIPCKLIKEERKFDV